MEVTGQRNACEYRPFKALFDSTPLLHIMFIMRHGLAGQLADFMIEFAVGVTHERSFFVPRIDLDYFED